MRPSKKFTLSLRDWTHGFITAFLGATLTSILEVVSKECLPTIDDVIMHIKIGLCAGIAYLIKKLLSNSEGKFMKREPKNTVQ